MKECKKIFYANLYQRKVGIDILISVNFRITNIQGTNRTFYNDEVVRELIKPKYKYM